MAGRGGRSGGALRARHWEAAGRDSMLAPARPFSVGLQGSGGLADLRSRWEGFSLNRK